MIIKLLPTDIPRFWETIKFASVKADEIEKKNLPGYCTELLHALLNDKAQCFVRLSDERLFEAMAITRIVIDERKQERYLLVQGLYSWAIVDDSTWRADMQFICKYAKQMDCKSIRTASRNPRAQEIIQAVGFVEETRFYTMGV